MPFACPYCNEPNHFHLDHVRGAVTVYACTACNRAGTMEGMIGLAAFYGGAGSERIPPAVLPRYNYGAFRSDVPVVIGILHYDSTEVVVNPALLQGDELLCSGVKVLVDIGYPPLLDGEVDEYDEQLDVWYVRLT